MLPVVDMVYVEEKNDAAELVTYNKKYLPYVHLPACIQDCLGEQSEEMGHNSIRNRTSTLHDSSLDNRLDLASSYLNPMTS
jgi:hypothetical protein